MQSAREASQKQLSGGGFSTIKIPEGMKMLKLEKGTMIVDIIPYMVGAGNPFADEGKYHYERTFWMHRGVGPAGDSYICLAKTKNEACPVCEYQARLRKGGEVDEKTLKEMSPKRRQLFHVVNRKDIEAGVQLLEASYAMFGKLLATRIDSDAATESGWDKFADPKEGMRLQLTIAEKSMGSNKYLEVIAIDFLPRKHQYGWKFVDENTVCLDDILKIPNYEKLAALLESGEEAEDVGGGDDDAPPARKKPVADDDDAPPPRKRPAALEDDDAPPAKPAKKPAAEEEGAWDDEAPPPPKKKPAPVAEDDDAPPPKKRPAALEDDDAPPPKKRPAALEDDDAPPPPKKRPAALEDDDASPPKKKPAAPADDGAGWDDEPPAKPAKKPAPAAEDDDAPPPKKKPRPVDPDAEE